jgi:hypothetical protein
VRLAFDDVGEEYVDFARLEERWRDLFDGENHGAGAEALMDDRAGLLELGGREDADGGWLDVYLDAVPVSQLPGNVRGDGCPALPAALVLATDSDAALHAILLDR